MKYAPLLLAMSLLALTLNVYADSAPNQQAATYILKNGTQCVDCRVLDKSWGATLLKPSIKYYYDRLLAQAAAGGEHFTLEKPDHTQIKISIRQLKQEQYKPEVISPKYNISLFSGEKHHSMDKALVDYAGKYFVFRSESGDLQTLPFQAVEYISDEATGQLIFNGIEIKNKIASLIQTSQQWNMAALGLSNSLNQQRALDQRDQYLRQQSKPTTVNCNTYGSSTTCSEW